MGFRGIYHLLCQEMSQKQARAVVAYARHGTQARAARELGISQPTLNERLANAKAKIESKRGSRFDWADLMRAYRLEVAGRTRSLCAA